MPTTVFLVVDAVNNSCSLPLMCLILQEESVASFTTNLFEIDSCPLKEIFPLREDRIAALLKGNSEGISGRVQGLSSRLQLPSRRYRVTP